MNAIVFCLIHFCCFDLIIIISVIVPGEGDYQLVGRASVDVIKASGYKISALEFERLMLEHADMLECAVVGVNDPTGVHGEEVCMMAVLKEVCTQL